MLRLRDAVPSRDDKSAIGAPRLVLSWVSKRYWSNYAPSTNVSLYKIAHCNPLRSELALPYSEEPIAYPTGDSPIQTRIRISQPPNGLTAYGQAAPLSIQARTSSPNLSCVPGTGSRPAPGCHAQAMRSSLAR